MSKECSSNVWVCDVTAAPVEHAFLQQVTAE